MLHFGDREKTGLPSTQNLSASPGSQHPWGKKRWLPGDGGGREEEEEEATRLESRGRVVPFPPRGTTVTPGTPEETNNSLKPSIPRGGRATS